MATELNYPEIIKKILLEYLKYNSADDVIKSSVSFDDEHGNYVLLQAGWRGDDYLQGAIIHIQFDNKIWIQYDGTEYSVANELVDDERETINPYKLEGSISKRAARLEYDQGSV